MKAALAITLTVISILKCTRSATVNITSTVSRMGDVVLVNCGTHVVKEKKKPAEVFDLSHWKLTLPTLDRKKMKAQEVKEDILNGAGGKEPYSDNDWFFIDDASRMVFIAPNHLATTKQSKNTRCELREMVRAGNKRIKTSAPGNNWCIDAHPEASRYGAIGGTLKATLSVDWVSSSGDDKKYPAYSVVVGQIHGSGKTEPLKIFYRKLPTHRHGSLFWNYESRPKKESNRKDIRNDVFGSHKLRLGDREPSDGIALGEIFSYEVKVQKNTMNLTFRKADGNVASFKHDLSKPHPKIQNDRGYATDWMYFKAGAYNQCNLGNAGCSNKGIGGGDFVRVSFNKLTLSH